MNKASSNDQGTQLNNDVITLGASGLAAAYQYNLLRKTSPNLSYGKKVAYCVGASTICFLMTRLMLKNINSIS